MPVGVPADCSFGNKAAAVAVADADPFGLNPIGRSIDGHDDCAGRCPGVTAARDPNTAAAFAGSPSEGGTSIDRGTGGGSLEEFG